MNAMSLLLVFISVALSSGSQIALKHGMISPAMQAALQTGKPLAIFLQVLTTPSVMLGLVCFGLIAVVWLFVLSRIPLSSAYPFVALGICVTVTAGYLSFGEALSAWKIIGVALILTGIFCVAKSA